MLKTPQEQASVSKIPHKILMLSNGTCKHTKIFCPVVYMKCPSVLLLDGKIMRYKVTSRYTAKFLAGHYGSETSKSYGYGLVRYKTDGRG